MSYIYHSYTNIGGRDKNEDAYVAIENKGKYLFVVADGLGGHEAGEIASGIVVNILQKQFEKSSKSFELEKAIRDANQAIMDKQKELGLRMRTTVTAVYVDKKKAVCANVGDSRTYLFYKGNIVFQSFDHSVAQMAVQSGEIEKKELRCHSDRNILTRALGSREDVKIDITILKEREFDSMLLCSDGFWEYVIEEEMQEDLSASQAPEIWHDKMYQRYQERIPYNNDNNTAIVVMKKRGVL